MYALLQLEKSEYEFFRKTSSDWKLLLIKAKEIVRTLLKCRFEIFNIEKTLDDSVMRIYKTVRPEVTAGFFQAFYKEMSQTKINIFDMYSIKRKEFKFFKDADNEETALTDSEVEQE